MDARIEPGTAGGVEQVILGLAGGFGSIDCSDFDIAFLSSPAMQQQLEPLLSSDNLRCIPAGFAHTQSISNSIARFLNTNLPEGLKFVLYRLFGSRIFRVPREQQLVSEDFDIIHFPAQQAFWTDKPNIYHPHDLQHLHLPDYFSRFTIESREFKYRAFCSQARVVAVTSTWIKDDLVTHYGLPEEKVRVIPLAPPNQHYREPDSPELGEIKRRLSLPERFVFYPAQTWKHKNHLNLIKAVAKIRDDQGYVVPLVFSGALTPYRHEIQSAVDELRLEQTVQFLGYISSTDLQALYRLCTAVVIPSLYEAASFPLWEAFLAGAPSACSSVTSLPRQADKASLVFDPLDVGQIATVVDRLWNDPDLRADLINRGTRRVQQFTWQATCTQFLALYRQILGRSGEGDMALLDREPLL